MCCVGERVKKNKGVSKKQFVSVVVKLRGEFKSWRLEFEQYRQEAKWVVVNHLDQG